ncbi:MAG: DUF429 domain-containing protein [Burkholderiales bacterium]|nr:DUF429 domain-containing protein [Burkholderiales bacterium]
MKLRPCASLGASYQTSTRIAASAMLRVSLQVLQGVSAKKEAALWNAGIRSWDDYERHFFPQRSLIENDSEQSSSASVELRRLREALVARDVAFFADRLERSEHYRIVLEFPEDALFLDIETTGLSRYYDQITLIGWCIGNRRGVHVQGQPDWAFRQALLSARSIVTFNGTLFDLPFIRHTKADIEFPAVHVDLRFLARRVGLTGGQKSIEKQIGMNRDSEVSEVSGEFAPVLWHRYVSGDLDALKALIKYNMADLDGMFSIFSHVSLKLAQAHQLPEEATGLLKALSRLKAPPRLDEQAIAKHLIPYPANQVRPIRLEDIVFVDRSPRLKVVGIDLTGSEKRPSGWCLLDGREASTAQIATDDELIALTHRANPHVVSIDSPLSLPEGRICVEDTDPGRQEFGIMRYCERVLKRRGVNVYPALLPSMQRLTARGIRLADRFRKLGIPVIESYPGAAQDIMRIPRKQNGLEYLEQGLAAFGISGQYVKGGVSHDELDAITSAAVGVFFWAGMMERLGPDPLGDEALIIPDLRVDLAVSRSRLVIGLSGALGAGKTTAARYLESLGCHYCRYSEVVERIVAARMPTYSRADILAEGEEIHAVKGQRWLGRQLIEPLLGKHLLVIDGLRFPEDHAFLTEVYGSQFLHIHVLSSEQQRRARFSDREGSSAVFDVQSRRDIESHFETMATLARDIIANDGSREHLHRAVDRIVKRDWRG